jgi:Gpi18-like mannosyltransferase
VNLAFGYENLSAYLVSAGEYVRFESGTPLNELEYIAEFVGSPMYEWETTITDDLDLYMFILNNNTYQVFCGYNYSILPSTFYPSLTVGFAGVFVTLLGLAWFLKGWKRFFASGVCINLLFFYIRIFTLAGSSSGFPDLFGIPFFFDWLIEPYNDYRFFYIRWIPGLWEGAWPYTLDAASQMSGYIYPPLWIYTVAALGSTPAWLPGLILFAFNMATGAVVFAISKELTGDERRSIFAMLLYLLNPITFFYGSYLWLNPLPYVFFVTLSFYLVLKQKPILSVASMAIAVLYKQFAVLFFPLLVLLLIKDNVKVDIRTALINFFKYSIIYAGIVLLASLPFLIVDLDAYIQRVLIIGYPPELLMSFTPSPGWPISFNTFFLIIGTPGFITTGLAYLLAYNVLLGLSCFLIFIAFSRYKLDDPTDSMTVVNRTHILMKQALFWCIIIVLVIQLFYPRGAYKYYLTILIPFISILFDHRDLELVSTEPFSFQRTHLIPVIVSAVVVLCFRLIYFWILIVWLLFYLRKSGRWISRRSQDTISSLQAEDHQS